MPEILAVASRVQSRRARQRVSNARSAAGCLRLCARATKSAALAMRSVAYPQHGCVSGRRIFIDVVGFGGPMRPLLACLVATWRLGFCSTSSTRFCGCRTIRLFTLLDRMALPRRMHALVWPRYRGVWT